jgi:hypothetical protein
MFTKLIYVIPLWEGKYNIDFGVSRLLLGLLCLTPLSTIFQLYLGVSFIGGGYQSTRRKPLILFLVS